jgi:glucose-6-phosphate isomerase
MINLKVDISGIHDLVPEAELQRYSIPVAKCFTDLYSGTGKGNEFLGWINLPSGSTDEVITAIEEQARKMQSLAKIFVVIGIGGSYLGARAVIEALSHGLLPLKKERTEPLVVYAGHQISEDYMAELLEILDQHDYALTVISKSGTTTEPAIAFRILKNHLEHKYGKQAAKERITAITDKEKGALKQLADKEGYTQFVVPDDVGGRYSVLTPVGLFPIAVAGIDIRDLLKGARRMEAYVKNNRSLEGSPVTRYAAARNALYHTGKLVEIMVTYQPNLFYLTEWWKQLYGESEGKDGKGIFPAGVNFTTDLHSMGQYIQDGLRILFETVLSVEKPKHSLRIPEDEQNLDKLNYLAGKRIHEVNDMAEKGTYLAHIDGNVPNIRIKIPELNPHTIGELIYFYEMACGVSGYLLGVNPFDQPGVEAYKRNMFALLGKPGMEAETDALRKRLEKGK